MKTQGGQATLELALCLPAVALVIGALVQVALLGGEYARTWQAAREAARIAAVEGDPGEIRAAVERSGIADAAIRVEPPEAQRRAGDPVTVTLTHRTRASVPLIGPLLARPITAEATMRIETP